MTYAYNFHDLLFNLIIFSKQFTEKNIFPYLSDQIKKFLLPVLFFNKHWNKQDYSQ